MMKNARTWALGASLAALGTLSIVSVALAQGGIQQPHNCFCEVPAEDSCVGVQMTASTRCDYSSQMCSCAVVRDEETGCVEALSAHCVDRPAP